MSHHLAAILLLAAFLGHARGDEPLPPTFPTKGVVTRGKVIHCYEHEKNWACALIADLLGERLTKFDCTCVADLPMRFQVGQKHLWISYCFPNDQKKSHPSGDSLHRFQLETFLEEKLITAP